MIINQNTDIFFGFCNTNPASSILLDFGDKDVRVIDNKPLGYSENILISKNYSFAGYPLISTTLISATLNTTYFTSLPGTHRVLIMSLFSFNF